MFCDVRFSYFRFKSLFAYNVTFQKCVETLWHCKHSPQNIAQSLLVYIHSVIFSLQPLLAIIGSRISRYPPLLHYKRCIPSCKIHFWTRFYCLVLSSQFTDIQCLYFNTKVSKRNELRKSSRKIFGDSFRLYLYCE